MSLGSQFEKQHSNKNRRYLKDHWQYITQMPIGCRSLDSTTIPKHLNPNDGDYSVLRDQHFHLLCGYRCLIPYFSAEPTLVCLAIAMQILRLCSIRQNLLPAMRFQKLLNYSIWQPLEKSLSRPLPLLRYRADVEKLLVPPLWEPCTSSILLRLGK